MRGEQEVFHASASKASLADVGCVRAPGDAIAVITVEQYRTAAFRGKRRTHTRKEHQGTKILENGN